MTSLERSRTKKFRFAKFLNTILIILQALLFMGITAQLFFAERAFTEISINLYGKGAPLMNSHLIDYLSNQYVAIIFLLISITALYKVVRVSNFKSKLLLNIMINIAHSLIGTVIIYSFYGQ